MERIPRPSTLPGDDLRRIMWRFAERRDLQKLIETVRSIAREPVADPARAWTVKKAQLVTAFDEAVTGPRNLALALAAFELAGVDGDAARVLEAVSGRTPVTDGLTTPARLLSAVEPILRRRRGRAPELGENEDVVHRLVDVWAAGEAGAALGFAAARLVDELDSIEKDESKNALADVVRPACTLWNIGHGADMMREAVRLMGDARKWMDAELEPASQDLEAAARRQLAGAMTDELFLAQLQQWIPELRQIAGRRPGTGGCNLASAIDLWLWTLRYLMGAKDAAGKEIFSEARQGVTFAMADGLCRLLAARYQMLDLVELAEKGPADPASAQELAGFVDLFSDLCRVQVARVAGEVGRIGAELVFGYHRHPSWDADGDACYRTEDLEALEGIIPGIGGHAVAIGDVIDADGSHPPKAGPCVRFVGMETFSRLRTKLDGCLTGARLAKERAARALTEMTIPEAPDSP
ncbi:MAG: hypothetical protein GY856_02405 [bacterium]|nr:hypothetical protein [bacterium]